MPDVTWTHPFLDVFLHYVPKNVRTVLDVGCGRGVVGSLIKIYREPERIVGIDLFEPYINFCKNLGAYTEVRKHDLGTTPLPFGDQEFDLSVALEVIEHLPKPVGNRLLEELERVSGTVMLSTPNRLFSQASYDANQSQRHLSRWTIQDLKKRGYSVLGVGGLMVFGREILYLSYALGRLTLLLPQVSSSLMAIRTKGLNSGPSHRSLRR